MKRLAAIVFITTAAIAGCSIPESAPTATTEAPRTWVEYNACLLAHYHEYGWSIPDYNYGARLSEEHRTSFLEDVAIEREVCAPWRPIPFDPDIYPDDG